MQRSNSSSSKGKLYVVGIGPGSRSMMTQSALGAIDLSDAVAGYTTYLSLIQDCIKDKDVLKTGMRRERERVEGALDMVLKGRVVSLVSGGDPGVYGMAGLVFEVCSAKNLLVDIEIIPGVTAANSAAALLGAPLSCDFCVLSLSNLLVEEDRIIKRAKGAASSDFVTVLYNPVSKKRRELISRIRDVFLEYKSPDTPVGIVRNIGRERESAVITDLDKFTDEYMDMVTTIVIGNSDTFVWSGMMVARRGY